MAERLRHSTGIGRVGLVGGVFQNALLTGQAVELLCGLDFDVVVPERVPVNDAGIAVGQVVEFAAKSGTL